jgi:hypothetical protein
VKEREVRSWIRFGRHSARDAERGLPDGLGVAVPAWLSPDLPLEPAEFDPELSFDDQSALKARSASASIIFDVDENGRSTLDSIQIAAVTDGRNAARGP